ncbi:MAG: cupin domain-containing protein [Burkholderiales bacterium]|nr:MAG: cupin domain-containing protein [Burkholderiales bacterium]
MARSRTSPPSPLSPLGALSVDQFLDRHWQRRPALLRQAFPGFRPPLGAAAIRAMALRDDAEARLIERIASRWRVTHGPLERLPSLRRRGWTVLVQGVDLLDDGVHALLGRFRFVPDARLDDVMVSFATDGGGVGPHVDSYDVFLLQAEGRRRWRIGRQRNHAFVPGLPLRILARFEPQHEYLLEPGDLLYLPPGWAHDGSAEGDCLTYSIGFRAPGRGEVLRAWFEHCADTVAEGGPQLRDPGRRATRQPARVPPDVARTLHAWIAAHRARPAEVDAFVGAMLSEPKPSVFFDAPRRPAGAARLSAVIARSGIVLDRRTRMLYDRARLYVNGETLALARAGRAGALWRRLADARGLEPAQAARLLDDPVAARQIEQWYRAGWLKPGRPAP